MYDMRQQVHHLLSVKLIFSAISRRLGSTMSIDICLYYVLFFFYINVVCFFLFFLLLYMLYYAHLFEDVHQAKGLLMNNFRSAAV